MEGSFNSALKITKNEQLPDQFESRAKQVLKDTESMAWGFHDGLSYTFYNFY
jgi:hypothetical protein